MKLLTLLVIGALALVFCLVCHTTSTHAQLFVAVEQPCQGSLPEIMAATLTSSSTRFRLEAKQSRFMVRTFSGGLLWFKGHDHFIAVRDFTGEAQLTPAVISPASLQFTVRADSLVETREVFTEQQKQIINKEIRELVLETAKYPEIVFRSTGISGKLNSAGQYEARIKRGI